MLPWTQKLGIRFHNGVKISQKVNKPSSSSSSSLLPLRGIFADSKISKGQLISIIPHHSAVILPQHAARYLSNFTTTTSSSSSSSSSPSSSILYQTSLKLSSANPLQVISHHQERNGDHHMLLPWFSRDQIMITSALATWKLFKMQEQHQQKQQAGNNNNNNNNMTTKSWNPFEDYLRTLPRGVPLMSTTTTRLEEEQENNNNNSSRFATPLDVRPSLNSSKDFSFTSTSKKQSLLSVPSSSKIPSSSLNLEETLTSNRHLTQLEHIGLLGKSLNFMSVNFARAVIATNTDMNNSSNSDNNNEDVNKRKQLYADARKSFEWAHFMVRSRSVCPLLSLTESQLTMQENNKEDSDLSSSSSSSSSSQYYHQQQQQQPLLIPFVDMINHNMQSPNIAVSWNRGASLLSAENANQKEILVTATKDIEKGEELLLNYANYKQRGRFMYAPDALELKSNKGKSSNSGTGLEGDDDNDNEKQKFRDLVYNSPAVQQLLSAQRNAGVCEDLLSWEWQYGFQIPKKELEFVRELLWAKSLKGRVKRMMDVRRRGRPGEFVVGVPEGLQQLKRHRERLEREVYGGQRIFPPQAE